MILLVSSCHLRAFDCSSKVVEKKLETLLPPSLLFLSQWFWKPTTNNLIFLSSLLCYYTSSGQSLLFHHFVSNIRNNRLFSGEVIWVTPIRAPIDHRLVVSKRLKVLHQVSSRYFSYHSAGMILTFSATYPECTSRIYFQKFVSLFIDFSLNIKFCIRIEANVISKEFCTLFNVSQNEVHFLVLLYGSIGS